MGTLTPRSASVVIYQGDDMDEFAHLHRRLEVTRRKADLDSGPRRLGDAAVEAAATEAQAAYDEFVDAAAERAVTVELRSIGRRRFRDLMDDHPPRSSKDGEGDHEDDIGYGVNVKTFPRALLTYIDPEDDTVRTVVAPQVGSKALADFVDDEITEGDFEHLWSTAYYLNRMPPADPKAGRSSSELQSSTETSESPARLG